MPVIALLLLALAAPAAAQIAPETETAPDATAPGPAAPDTAPEATSSDATTPASTAPDRAGDCTSARMQRAAEAGLPLPGPDDCSEHVAKRSPEDSPPPGPWWQFEELGAVPRGRALTWAMVGASGSSDGRATAFSPYYGWSVTLSRAHGHDLYQSLLARADLLPFAFDGGGLLGHGAALLGLGYAVGAVEDGARIEMWFRYAPPWGGWRDPIYLREVAALAAGQETAWLSTRSWGSGDLVLRARIRVPLGSDVALEPAGTIVYGAIETGNRAGASGMALSANARLGLLVPQLRSSLFVGAGVSATSVWPEEEILPAWIDVSVETFPLWWFGIASDRAPQMVRLRPFVRLASHVASLGEWTASGGLELELRLGVF